ncbi:glycosyltransferase family 2 protein [Demequina sp. SYSU T00039]|uniref:Glycosyltransferase family 2 protein n=1 Tax=Demequina lignilytica TaxID=3051663 RepID=A0AAW7M446_9MICO|nr:MULTISPECIES: glycosyltransferase family 2 protein [unclassified Demequina]MDN4477614.1 glycosyltransferase family 2 protein [Demequina sp. SYSU T00039-1]MDN4488035.1 glycosyltransferase family 2 protein [Demequina sp. SYSU T00039]MDN4490475.1 glycosyltransferase family 2 protein [Demequina sp. SYSU T00068]
MAEDDALSRRPLVSVVAPVFNPGEELGDALRNIASLTYPELEVILVDDASTVPSSAWGAFDMTRPGTRRIVEWMRLPENVGPAGARNAGLRAASGEYVWFVDWDDEWDPGILDRLVEEAESTGADFSMCRGRWQIGAEEGPPTDGHDAPTVMDREGAFLQLLHGGIRGYLWTKLFRRSVLGVDPFAPHGYIEDFFVVADVVDRCETVASIPETLYRHLVRAGSLSNSKDPQLHHLEEANAHVRQLAAGFPQTPALRRGLAHFELEFDHIARATTALRLCSDARAREVLRGIRRQIRSRDVLLVLPIAPGTASRATAIKLAGPYFLEVRAAARSLKRLVRRGGRGLRHPDGAPAASGAAA